MRIPSKDFTVSLDHVSYFLSIHKAEFFNPSAGARMVILLPKSWVEIISFAILLEVNLQEKQNLRKPQRIHK